MQTSWVATTLLWTRLRRREAPLLTRPTKRSVRLTHGGIGLACTAGNQRSDSLKKGQRVTKEETMKLAKLTSGAGMMLIIMLALASTLPAQTQTLTVLHNFTNFPDGGRPTGRLLLDPAGNLYGTTTIGGNIGYGSVFKVDTSGNLSKIGRAS